MSFDCVLLDCSGSMAATHGRSSKTRMQYALDKLFGLYQMKTEMPAIDGRTLIVPFESTVRGGITMDLLLKMGRSEVSKLFAPAGGTNIEQAFKYCGSSNTLLITDEPEAGKVMGKCCPIIYIE